jgi:hypothetical protein
MVAKDLVSLSSIIKVASICSLPQEYVIKQEYIQVALKRGRGYELGNRIQFLVRPGV